MLVYLENGEPAAPRLFGGWSHEVPTEPMHLAEELIAMGPMSADKLIVVGILMWLNFSNQLIFPTG